MLYTYININIMLNLEKKSDPTQKHRMSYLSSHQIPLKNLSSDKNS